MNHFAPGSLLAQLQATAGPVLAYSAIHQTEIERIVVANVITTNDRYSIYHADEGQGASVGCALYYQNVLSANTTITPVYDSDGSGVTVKAGGRVYVESSGTFAITFSIYGVTRAGR